MNPRILETAFVLQTYGNRSISIERGENVWLFDNDNKKYLDLMSNYGASILGHGNEDFANAITEQAKKLINLHGSFANLKRAIASKQLIQRAGKPYAHVYWANSGAEAVEAALKFAVLANGKKKFIRIEKGYHGKTLGALSATDGEHYRTPFEPLMWEFISVPFNDVKELNNKLSNDIGAVILEPILGEGGIIMPEEGYLQQVEKICKENDVLLIIDEIQTGTGRTGTFLASQRYGCNGDIVCLGKGLAGGLPVGATLVTKQVAAKTPRRVHSSTFGGNPLVMTAVSFILNYLSDEKLTDIENDGEYFMERLHNIKRCPLLKKVRGKGLMIGIEVTDYRDEMLKLLQKNGILAIPAYSNVIRFLPPYSLPRGEMDWTCEILQDVCKGVLP